MFEASTRAAQIFKMNKLRAFLFFFRKNTVKAATFARAVSRSTVLARQHIVFKRVAIVTKRRLASGDLRKKERERKKKPDNLLQLRAS